MKEIAGYENEKKQLNQLKEMLHKAKDYKRVGIRIPRGLILYGEPGVGKTVMARSIADDGITLVELRAADCCDKDTEENIRRVFEEVKSKQPAVLLLDELDKIAGRSDRFYMESNDDVNKILLQEIDGLSVDDIVLVVATCNRTEELGEALLRPGRFDRMISIKKPNKNTRVKILNYYLNKININKKVNIDYVAKITNGFTGAEIECLINEACILATEQNVALNIEHIKVIMNRLAFKGVEEPIIAEMEERRKIAVHEAGHTIAALKLLPDELVGASIIPQGDSGGHTHLAKVDGKIRSIQDSKNEVAVLLAGRIAEREYLGETYLGSSNDLEEAIKIMFRLATHHGIFGYGYLLDCLSMYRQEIMSEQSKDDIRRSCDEAMNQMDKKVVDIINANKELFDTIVTTLMKKQFLSKDEIIRMEKRISK